MITETKHRTLIGDRVYFDGALPVVFDGWNQDVSASGPHVDDFFRDGDYLGEDDNGLEPEFAEINSPVDCDGQYEVHFSNLCWAVVNSSTGQVRCEFSSLDEAVSTARELNVN